MVGSITEIVVASAVVALLAGLLKYTFGSGDRGGALPEVDGDVGLLETVAVVPTREAADILAARLARERVRTTVSRTEVGWKLLVFPEQAEDARVVLHMGE
jgi:hypothetical protein